jgi:hypothetical protein
MLLNVVTPERRLAHSPAGDMALVAGLFVVALTYLDVPFWNALLFGPSITLQAAVGVVVLTRLLKGVPGSLLLSLGPGLILGGALSFGIFQMVGRGTLGLVVVVAVGIGAVAILISSTTWQPLSASRMWTLGQLLGLAALALTWEFPELLPVAAAFFVVGFFTGDSPKVPRWLAWTVGVLASVAIALVPILRQDYWWLITDDYKFFEVLSFHITKSGPLADWGVGNWGTYHWLSYGWTGLLNVLGGNPETFTTITRVMPLTYSTALAASLILITSTLRNKFERLILITVPTWAILSINRLDWSGLSSAGVYAVIAATAAITILALYTNQTLTRRIGTYLCFTPIIALTKMPSIFAIALFILLAEATPLTKRLRPLTQTLTLVLTGFACAGVIIVGLWLSSGVIEDVKFGFTNPSLGQLAEADVHFVFYILVIQKLYVLVPIIIVMCLVLNNKLGTPMSRFLIGLCPGLFLATAFEILVTSHGNVYEYFSGPAYLVGSFALLVPSVTHKQGQQHDQVWPTLFIAVLLIGIGDFWMGLHIYENVWNQLGGQLFGWSDLEIVLAQYFSQDSRVGAALAASLGFLVLVSLSSRVRQKFLTSLLLATCLLTLQNYSFDTVSELSRIRTTDEIEANIGAVSAQTLGTWVRSITAESELLATNYLYDFQTGRPLTDFSLAAWAEREFLVLGPSFLFDFDSHISDVEASIQFGAIPSATTARDLTKRGVRWFVVDKWNTNYVDWNRAWDVKYENERFLVVKL